LLVRAGVGSRLACAVPAASAPAVSGRPFPCGHPEPVSHAALLFTARWLCRRRLTQPPSTYLPPPPSPTPPFPCHNSLRAQRSQLAAAISSLLDIDDKRTCNLAARAMLALGQLSAQVGAAVLPCVFPAAPRHSPRSLGVPYCRLSPPCPLFSSSYALFWRCSCAPPARPSALPMFVTANNSFTGSLVAMALLSGHYA